MADGTYSETFDTPANYVCDPLAEIESSVARHYPMRGYWKFNEAVWNGTPDEVIDYSGQGMHLTRRQGATSPSTSIKKFGVASGYFEVDPGTNRNTVISRPYPDEVALRTDEKCTISMWLYLVNQSGTFIMHKRTSPGNPALYSIEIFEVQLECWTAPGGAFTALKSGVDPSTILNQWVHVFISWGDGVGKFWVNGVLKDTNNSWNPSSVGTGNVPPPDFAIGGRVPLGVGQTFKGYADDFVVWKEKFTQDQVDYIYNSGTGRIVDTTQKVRPVTTFYEVGLEKWKSFTETTGAGHAGEIKYQLSFDEGVTWHWYTGGAWTAAGADETTANTAAQLTNAAMEKIYPAYTTSKKITFRAFLVQTSPNFAILDQIDIGYQFSRDIHWPKPYYGLSMNTPLKIKVTP
jgi:hypothetical protein